jgi:predicted helicase
VTTRLCRIRYHEVDDLLTARERLEVLDQAKTLSGLTRPSLTPDEKGNWITEGLKKSFANHIALVPKRGDATGIGSIFASHAIGVSTNRDDVVYGSGADEVWNKIQAFARYYNAEVHRLRATPAVEDLDSFVDPLHVKWSETLKRHLKNKRLLEPSKSAIRTGLYRPFFKRHIYFSEIAVDRPSTFPELFPAGANNRAIAFTGKGGRRDFTSLMVDSLADLHVASSDGFHYAALLKFDKDGRPQDNITDWALAQFRSRYGDKKITKRDMFNYVYGVLHHPDYRTRYAANLKGELPRIPFASDFRGLSKAGEKLAELHLNYERLPEYPLRRVEAVNESLDWRVQKMKLSRDKRQVIYNTFLTLDGIPSEAFAFKLGNRSGLEWVVDQYQVRTDELGGIVDDPNRANDQEYIIRLIGKVITASLETLKLVRGLPPLSLRPER